MYTTLVFVFIFRRLFPEFLRENHPFLYSRFFLYRGKSSELDLTLRVEFHFDRFYFLSFQDLLISVIFHTHDSFLWCFLSHRRVFFSHKSIPHACKEVRQHNASKLGLNDSRIRVFGSTELARVYKTHVVEIRLVVRVGNVLAFARVIDSEIALACNNKAIKIALTLV